MSRRRPGLVKSVPLSRAQRIRWSDRSLRKLRRYDPLQVKNVLDEIRDTMRQGAKHSNNEYESMLNLLKQVPAFPEKAQYQSMVEQIKQESQRRREWLKSGSALDASLIHHLSEPESVQRSLLESFEDARSPEENDSKTMDDEYAKTGVTPWLNKTMGHIDSIIDHAAELSKSDNTSHDGKDGTDVNDDGEERVQESQQLSDEIAERLTRDIVALENELKEQEREPSQSTRARTATRTRKEKRLSTLREEYLILLNDNKFLLTSNVLPLSKNKGFERAFNAWLTSKHFRNNPALHARDVAGAWIDKRRLLELLEQKYVLSIPERKLLPPGTYQTPLKRTRR